MVNERENATLCRDIAAEWQRTLDEHEQLGGDIITAGERVGRTQAELARVDSQIEELEQSSKIPARAAARLSPYAVAAAVAEALAISRRLGQLRGERQQTMNELSRANADLEIARRHRRDAGQRMPRLAAQYEEFNCRLYAAKPF
jgi:chromosome segregation ATPase